RHYSLWKGHGGSYICIAGYSAILLLPTTSRKLPIVLTSCKPILSDVPILPSKLPPKVSADGLGFSTKMNQTKHALALLRNPCPKGALQQLLASTSFGSQQFRHIGGDKIPEYWGKPSAYTEGTDFLGTPKNHLDLIKKRPLSPDVLEIDNKSLHYKFPLGALSSIANRVTGVAMSVGFAGAGILALRGSLDGVVTSLAGNFVFAFPLK
ncbi:hypothetical protein VaNZ11_004148, partial [Volvox africanus]